MTCHGVLKPFKFYSSSICCKNFLLSHTGQNIFTESTKTLQEFKIDDKLFKVVHDNGANIVKANKLSLIDMHETDLLNTEDDKLENESINNDFNSYIDSIIDIDEEDEETAYSSIEDVVSNFLESFEREKRVKSNRCFDHTLQLVVNDSKAECTGVAKTMKKIFATASKSHIVHLFVNFFTEKGIYFITGYYLVKFSSKNVVKVLKSYHEKIFFLFCC
jgi:hypothetical protein